MIKGIIFSIAACFIWGFIFVVPQFMTGFTSIEITLGCYLFYGVVSLCILFKDQLQGRCRYPLSIWSKSLYFSLVSTIVYYACVVLALRYSTPAICALILGINPIVITFYGNLKKKECRFRSLIFPAVLVLLGLVIINVPQFSACDSPSEYSLGLLCGFMGLASWSWYVVENSRFLKDNAEVSASDWSTLIGVATLFWVAFLALIIGLFFTDYIEFQKYVAFDMQFLQFLIGCAVLGLFCTWLGAIFWNKASMRLPVPLLGQLAIFETIFGLLFVYTLDQRLPTSTEYIGITFLLTAVAYGIRKSAKMHTVPSHS